MSLATFNIEPSTILAMTSVVSVVSGFAGGALARSLFKCDRRGTIKGAVWSAVIAFVLAGWCLGALYWVIDG